MKISLIQYTFANGDTVFFTRRRKPEQIDDRSFRWQVSTSLDSRRFLRRSASQSEALYVLRCLQQNRTSHFVEVGA